MSLPSQAWGPRCSLLTGASPLDSRPRRRRRSSHHRLGSVSRRPQVRRSVIVASRLVLRDRPLDPVSVPRRKGELALQRRGMRVPNSTTALQSQTRSQYRRLAATRRAWKRAEMRCESKRYRHLPWDATFCLAGRSMDTEVCANISRSSHRDVPAPPEPFPTGAYDMSRAWMRRVISDGRWLRACAADSARTALRISAVFREGLGCFPDAYTLEFATVECIDQPPPNDKGDVLDARIECFEL